MKALRTTYRRHRGGQPLRTIRVTFGLILCWGIISLILLLLLWSCDHTRCLVPLYYNNTKCYNTYNTTPYFTFSFPSFIPLPYSLFQHVECLNDDHTSNNKYRHLKIYHKNLHSSDSSVSSSYTHATADPKSQLKIQNFYKHNETNHGDPKYFDDYGQRYKRILDNHTTVIPGSFALVKCDLFSHLLVATLPYLQTKQKQHLCNRRHTEYRRTGYYQGSSTNTVSNNRTKNSDSFHWAAYNNNNNIVIKTRYTTSTTSQVVNDESGKQTQISSGRSEDKHTNSHEYYYNQTHTRLTQDHIEPKQATLNETRRPSAVHKPPPTDQKRPLHDDSRPLRYQKQPPRVVLLLTRWRSGSTFLGGILANAVPHTFYR